MKRSLYLALFSLILSVGTMSAMDALAVSSSSFIPDGVSGSAAIQTQPLSSATFCTGSQIVVEFTTSGTGFDGSTSYSVELSDAAGSFAAPVILPQLGFSAPTLQNNGYIYVSVPGTVAEGSGYRLRVVSSSPEILGSDNGVDLTFTSQSALTAPSLTINGATQFCFGSASTYIVSSVEQGNLWFPGGTNTNPFIGAILSGNYFTQITTSLGCATNSAPATIQANAPVFGFLAYFENGQVASTSDTTVNICEGDSLEIGVIIEGGTPPFDIVYTPDGFNFEFINDVGEPYAENTFVYSTFVSNPGIYQLIAVSDAFEPPCNSQGTTGTVVVQLVPPPVTAFSYEPFCGAESGVPVAAPGFLGGGIYSFDPIPSDGATINPNTGVISNAVIGNTYTVRYTVSEGLCTDVSSTASITVSSSDVVAFTINPFCEGVESGFPVTAPGFEGGGTYSFNPPVSDGATINAITGIISGAAGATTYSIEYFSPEGECQSSSITSVTTIDAPEIALAIVNSTCGNSDGSIDATITEGVAPYTSSWSNGSTSEDVSGLESGAYTLTVTDAQGCSAESTATLINSNQPELVLNAVNATCGSNNGSIDLTINNGVGPYTITWTPGGQTTEDISGLAAGTYTVEVIDLSTSCEVSGSATILFQGAPTATFIATNTLCGQSVGSVDVTVTGGTAPITYAWSNGATTEDIAGLGVGAYTDTITDANGCFTIVSVNIVNENQFSLSAVVVNPTCGTPNGGAIDLTVNGGDAPFQFAWTPNSTTVTEDAADLTAGEYQVVVTDNAGCVDSLTSTLAPALPLEIVGETIDATCGNSDGSVNISVTGGSGLYTFVWDNGANDEDLSGIPAGSYNVIVSDQSDANCTISSSFTVVNGNQPEVSIEANGTSCTANTGTIALSITDGSGNYSFAWTGPDGFVSDTEDLNNLAAGTYSVTITDNETTCIVNESAEVTPANAPSYTSNVVQTSCGQNNGIIDIEVIGGTQPFTITWNGESSTLDQINLSAGSYTFLLVDANNCELTETFTINSSLAPSLTSVFANPACGNDTGSVNVTITDASNPIVYSWTKDGASFANSEDISALSPGSYILVATDAAGCAVSDTFDLIYENQPTLSFVSNPSLCGESTGTVNLTVDGGTAPFVFEWSGPENYSASTEDITGLAGGCYTVVVTDAATCEVTLQACVVNSDAPSITFNTIQPSCNEDNGSIAPVVSGGQAPFTFEWSGTQFSLDSLIDNLGNGNYVLTLTDAAGCQTIDSVALNNTGIPIVTGNVENPECGIGNGSITAVVTGGLAPYQFLWTPGGSTDATLSNLEVGSYTVLVTDATGCEATGQFTIENFNGPEITFTTTNSLCGENNGSIDITVSEGSGDYSFLWTGAGVDVNGEDQEGLASGAYVVLVTDNVSGCEATLTIDIQNSNQPVLNLVSVGTLCGANSGSVELTVTNAVNPTFSWEGPNGFTASTEDINELSTGVYTVTVTDGACEVTGSVSVSPTKSVWSQNVNIVAGSQYSFEMYVQNVIANSPAQLRVFVGSNNIGSITPAGVTTWNQFTGSFTATTSGLTEVKIVNENLSPSGNDFGLDDISLIELCPVSPQPGSTCGTNIIVNGDFEAGNTGFLSQYTFVPNGPANNELIPEGRYTIAANANTTHPQFQGTGRSGNFMVVNGNEPEDPILNFSTVGTSCSNNNGSINLTVSNFTIPITYAWTGPNGFTATSQDLNNLASGAYNVTVTSGACSETGSATVGFSNLPELVLAATPTECGATNGAIDLSITNATNPTISWSGPDGFSSNIEDIANLAEGTYFVTVTEGSCVVEDSIGISTNEPTLAFNIVPSSCSGAIGSIDLTVTNASNPTFSWSGPDGFTATTEDISALAAGDYTLIVTDGACTVEGSATVNTDEPTLSFSASPTSCGTSAGSIDLTVTNGSNPTFSWTGPDGFTATTEDISSLAAGDYTVTVTDGACSVEGTASVDTDEPTLALSTTPTSCGASAGSIDLTVTNGSNPTFSWSGPDGFTATTEDISSLAAGDYTVTVTDGACSVEGSASVTNSDGPTLTFSTTSSACGASTGSIDLTVTNGTNPTFSWSGPNGFAATTEDISSLAAGDYTVTVSDGACSVEGSATVDTDEPTLALSASPTSCGASTGSIDLTVTNGSNPTFSWSGPDGFTATTEDISSLAAGDYTVIVTDGACSVEGSASVANSDDPILAFSTSSSACGASTGSIDLTVTNGNSPTFSWSGPDGFAATTEDISALAAGDYTVIVTAGACSVEGSATVDTDEPTLALSASPSSCGASTGSIELTVTNGSNPTFSWSGPDGFTATTEDISSLAAGDYTVTVTDGACSVEGSATVNTNEPTLALSASPTSCGASTGSIDLTVTNGNNPTFSWSGPNGFAATTEDINGLAAGDYTVTVTEGTCTVEGQATVTNSDGPTASISASAETICSGVDVQLTISFTGTAPYTFTYTDGTTPLTISGYDADQYVITVNPTSTVTYSLVDLVSDPNPDCEGTFINESVTVNVSSSPTAPSISANGPTSFCEGQSVVLTSSEADGNFWNVSGPDQFNQSITVSDEGSYFVVVLNEFGCADTSNTIDVEFLPNGLELSFTDTTICAGTSIQLVATGADEYLWSPSVYLSTILSGTTTCTPFETTTYIVSGSNACGSGSDTVTVTVTPIAATDLGADLSLCQNAPLTLSVPFEDGVTYSWGPASAITGQADSSTAQINTSTSTDVYLQTINSNGCSFTDTVSISIEVPLASFNISTSGSTTVCQGDSVVLLATTGNLVVWSNGLENFDEILVTESGDYYAIYNGSNCPAYSDTISITVNPLPAVDILSAGSLTVCEGTCANLQSSAVNGFVWTLADGSTSTEASIEACNNGWYVLTGTDNGCSASDSAFVTVLPQIDQPVITLDGSDVICEGQSTSTLISSYATGNQWLLNGQPLQGATSNTLVISVGGTYSVQVNAAAGCSGTSATIEILQKSTDPIEIIAADTIVCNNEQINVLLTATPGFVSYTWFGNGEAGDSYTATYLGQFAVVGINEDGCQSTDYINIVGNVPFEVEAVSPVLYDDFNVSYAGAQDGEINVDVTGGSGIFTYAWSNGSNAEDLTGLAGGDYTLTVTDEQGCSVVSTITVKEPGLIKLPNGFTPNGDGFNDFYVIRGIQGYEGNQINVFNRWGSLVYSAKDYQNNWDGISNDGNLLPDGTYFIVVNLNKEGFDNVQSYIDLRRN